MKILLVDDEVQILRGVTRFIESEVDEWEVETATSGTEALELLEEEEFNVIISDMRMPLMDGAQLLEQVEKRFPNLLRVILSGQADRDAILRAIQPMHQYLVKPCKPEKLVEVIRRAELFRDTISSTEILNAIGNANCFPALPQIVMDVNKELDSENGTSETLGEIVSQDPLLSAKVLQLANSAIFGMKNPVVEVSQGVSVVGADMIRAISVSLSLLESAGSAKATISKQLFEHCVEVATIGRQIAKWEKMSCDVSKSIVSGGLLHDIGKIVLLNAFEEDYMDLISQSETDGTPLFELEMNKFKASHAGIGGYLLAMWGLPPELTETITSHHSLKICSRASEACQVVFAANWIARGGDEDLFPKSEVALCQSFVSRLIDWRDRYLTKQEEELCNA